MPKADVSWYPIPEGSALCPCCNGTGVGRALDEKEQAYSWNRGKTHYQCTNCGGQDMGGTARGHTKIDPATGLGCKHNFVGRNAGRCYTVYTCTKCYDKYDIDSGD